LIQVTARSTAARRVFSATAASLALGLVSQAAMAETLVDVDTPLGSFQLSLDDAAAPQTVDNFLRYVTSGRLDNSVVHRSISNFMVQGGGFYADAGLTPVQTWDPIALENSGLNNVRGTIAMARTADLNSATSQWFINTVDNAFLNGAQGYAVFGKVVGDGMRVVDAIAALPTYDLTGSYGPVFTDVPLAQFSDKPGYYLVSTKFTVVPEPGTFALMGLGLVGLAAVARRRA
jgi:peptidyl-prolyl cis-trans isomerase A (cyclophilin A)